MSTDRLNDPRAFREFLDSRLPGDGPSLTLDDYLDLWQHENESTEEFDATVQAVREALDDWRAGEKGTPANEVISALRRKHNLPDPR